MMRATTKNLIIVQLLKLLNKKHVLLFPILHIWTRFTRKPNEHCLKCLTAWDACIYTSFNCFLHKSHFSSQGIKVKPNTYTPSQQMLLVLHSPQHTHGHVRSAHKTVFYHVLEWVYRAGTSHTVICELTPNSQRSRLPGWVFNWQVGMRELYICVCV